MKIKWWVVGILVAVVVGSVVARASEDGTRIIAGELANPTEYPEVVLLQNGCTASIAGPRTVITAGHCYRRTSSFKLNGKTYALTQTRSPKYKTSIFGAITGHDMVLGLTAEVIDLPLEKMARPEISGTLAGLPIDLVGYGCTRWQSSVGYGELRRGWADVTTFSRNGFDVTTRGRSAICQGDSGGPAFVPGVPHRQVGIHSRGNGRDSIEVRMDSQASKDFLQQFIDNNDAEICGLNLDCGGHG
jgi:hypothetical protein